MGVLFVPCAKNRHFCAQYIFDGLYRILSAIAISRDPKGIFDKNLKNFTVQSKRSQKRILETRAFPKDTYSQRRGGLSGEICFCVFPDTILFCQVSQAVLNHTVMQFGYQFAACFFKSTGDKGVAKTNKKADTHMECKIQSLSHVLKIGFVYGLWVIEKEPVDNFFHLFHQVCILFFVRGSSLNQK
nr:hypothetical protein [Kiloniella majae]